MTQTSTLSLTNTATGKKAAFSPAYPSMVGMYVCGPTVYDRAHIGNARSAVVFDLLFRILRRAYGDQAVTYARNFTDIDDKIIARAVQDYPHLSAQDGIEQLTTTTTKWYHEDMDALGVLRPTHEPRATQFVTQMIEDIETMIKNGGAYVSGDHVFFSATANQHRGVLSGRHDLEDDAVNRIEPNPLKRHQADFVLWKSSDEGQPGWDSPWGKGRPGWHIECSAMSTRLLGQSFDIHGGGSDLTFPHHDNEIAQARCCAPQEEYARTWLHNGMITVDGQKMSKSAGNFLTVEDLRHKLPGGALRLGLLMSQYRSSLDWSQAHEQQVFTVWRRFAALAKDAAPGEVPATVWAALCDDMNTPAAIEVLHTLAADGDAAGLRASLDLMGISLQDDRDELPASLSTFISDLISARDEARTRKDFATSDELRDGLLKAGVILKDASSGTQWETGPDFDASALPTL